MILFTKQLNLQKINSRNAIQQRQSASKKSPLFRQFVGKQRVSILSFTKTLREKWRFGRQFICLQTKRHGLDSDDLRITMCMSSHQVWIARRPTHKGKPWTILKTSHWFSNFIHVKQDGIKLSTQILCRIILRYLGSVTYVTAQL